MTSNTTPFTELGLDPDLLSAIESAGYVNATAVQAEGIPAFLNGGDILIQAQTGTGKTAAFVLPIIQQLQANPGTVEVLVLAPTRELAKQVCGEFSHFGKLRGIHATPIYGGTSFEKQHQELETAQIVVATPGRLLDLMRRGKLDPSGIRFFGLDEADELLSMGFEKDVLDVVAQIPKKRQSFICSATMNPSITGIARNFITDPTVVDVSSDAIGAKSVRHEHFKVAPSEKLEALRRLVQTDARNGAIVFANTRAATFLVTDALAREDISVDVLNGELSQADRELALSRMRDDSVQFLVATDVAARGIDISGLPAVINYDMPESPDVYIHRTGRTGRAGQAGVAYSLVCPSDISVFHQLQKFYHLEFNETELPTRERLRAVVADEILDNVLEGLDAGADLNYAAHLPLAKRLHDRPDGARVIAKLIAHFEQGGATAIVSAAADTAKEAPVKAIAAPVADAVDVVVEEAPAAPAPKPARSRKPAAAKAAAPREEAPEETAQPVAAPAAPAADAKPLREGRRNRRIRNEAAAAAPAAAAPAAAAPAAVAEPEAAIEAAPEAKAEPAKPKRAPKKPAAEVTGDLTADVLADALSKASRQRGRWRGTRSLAQELEVSEEDVVALLESDDARFEPSHKKPGRWRLLVAPDEDGDSAPREARKPAERPKREARNADSDSDGARPEREGRRSRSKKTDEAPRARREEKPARREKPAKQAKPPKNDNTYVTLTVNVGANHGADVDTLSEELILLAGLDSEDVGRVLIEATSSRVDVVEDFWEDMLNAIQGQLICGETVDASGPRRRSGKRRS